MAWIKVKEDEWQSPITKFFNENEIEAMRQALNAEPGDLILFGADSVAVVNQVLSELRLELGRRLGLMDSNVYNFLWVTDFPLVEFDSERKRYAAVHHPFTAPLDEDLALLDTEPLKVRSRAYDLVLNGSGSIRDVVAFPKTQKATCPLTDTPGSVARKQLTELHLRPDWKEA